ncbi:MAG: superoxide dismutase [Parvibaculum sp.]
MSFPLPDLPYADTALEPHMSKATFDLHHGKHHRAYATKLEELVAGTPYAEMTLEQVVRKSYADYKKGDPKATPIFNNAAQHLNHSFFWTCMTPGGSKPTQAFLDAIAKDFGDFDKFKEAFIAAGVGQFGSGWVWLVDNKGKLEIVKTGNAETPVAEGKKPLIVADVWEHAYYVDYQNRRPDYLKVFTDNLADWAAASERLAG